MAPVTRLTLTTRPDGVVSLAGPLDRDSIPAVEAPLEKAAKAARGNLVVDLTGVDSVDTAAVALFDVLKTRCTALGGELSFVGLSDVARDAFAVLKVAPAAEPTTRKREGIFVRVADSALGWWQGFVNFSVLTADTMLLSFSGAPRTSQVQKGAMAFQAMELGARALPIVGLISLLIGVVLALQSAYQLRQFGGTLYVANLIAVSMTREMGPLMTAIIIAGRSGAAIAAEVATMNVSEEMSALRVMGLNPTRFVIVPRFQALTLTLPALVIYANLIGILGGLFVAMVYLDLGAEIYLKQAWRALVPLDVLTGLLKSVVFAWIIVLVAAHEGLKAYGGADAVGRSTTASVVRSIFVVIVADALFSLVFYFGD